MSQLVPYHLVSGEQDDSLMFATMFDYQTDEYNKPVDLINESINCAITQPDLSAARYGGSSDANLYEAKSPADLTYIKLVKFLQRHTVCCFQERTSARYSPNDRVVFHAWN
ncbi:unnamed protein product [Parnassius apollo]|uniref:(apollo) hypothetical protein n=1 Tax=Parnassius apollo TaxID=110799 RepID=A0A8S3VY72_PARAO|nr:unnamed protein product [Parnassius apollo]